MKKNNKDYKPWDEYLEDQKQKDATAEYVANQVLALTAEHHVDIGKVIGCLKRGLVTTGSAASELELSPRAFLRLRRKYDLQPVYKEWMNSAHTERRYMYTLEQLKKIPPLEITLSRRRMALAKQGAGKRRSAAARRRRVAAVARGVQLVRRLVTRAA